MRAMNMTGLSVLLVLSLSACTTSVIKEAELPLSRNNMCAEPSGASMRYNTVTMALGQRPNAGYGIDLTAQTQRSGVYQLAFREVLPKPHTQYAQMTVSPCIQVIVPHGWKSVTVIRQDTHERWQFTPDLVSTSQKTL